MSEQRQFDWDAVPLPARLPGLQRNVQHDGKDDWLDPCFSVSKRVRPGFPSASVLTSRTPLDVAIGPWRAIIDVAKMTHGGLGARAGTAVPEGAVHEPSNPPLIWPALLPAKKRVLATSLHEFD
jgi:hypothetical protein